MTAPRIAIVLFNLGGPDNQAAVQPFLQNLFSDPAIIRAPGPIRWLLARLISKRRAPVAKEIYAKMGGGSPIVPNTQAQASALEAELGEGHKCFIAMRYWHPRAAEVVKALNDYQPDQVILLPLYPQFSSTTTASSFDEFFLHISKQLGHTIADYSGTKMQRGEQALNAQKICCYPINEGFIKAQAALIRPYLEEAAKHGAPRLLLSSHGLPEKVIAAGDPYQWQCEQTAQAIIKELNWPGLDWLNCYQSRVGPLKWIGPSTEDEVERAGADKVPVVLAPIAFVSEHSETLVELDIEYRELAHESGVPFYGRVPTVDTHPAFISGLAGLVRRALSGQPQQRLCPAQFGNCSCRRQ